jgi:subtilisin family serine protease
MGPLEVVRLSQLMERSHGRPEITVALIDGPVALDRPELATANIRALGGALHGGCTRADTYACMHGTFVAAMLAGRRGSVAPAICPGCTLLVRPVFAETTTSGGVPNATPEALADAIVDCVVAGARIINLSAALLRASRRADATLNAALNYAGRQGVITVAAAGNQGALGSSVITRHPAVVPVAACDDRGRPLDQSNLGHSIGLCGLRAPGANITSLGADGTPRRSDGTSAAAPFVSGAIALLWSEFPDACAVDVRIAVTAGARRTVVPPLLNAWSSYERLASARTGRQVA